MSRILCTFGIMGLGAGFAFLALVALLMIPGNSESRAHAQSTSVSLGENTEYISPELWGTLQKHADGEDVPTNVIVELGTRSDITVTPVLSEYLTSINAVAIEGKKDTYRIPTASALSVVQRADVAVVIKPEPEGATGQVVTPGILSQLDDSLQDVVKAVDEGIDADEAARYAKFIANEYVLIAVNADNASTISSIRSWLMRRMIYVPPTPSDQVLATNRMIVLVPADDIEDLVDEFDTTYFESSPIKGTGLPMDRSEWEPDALAYVQAVVMQYQRPMNMMPGGDSGPGPGGRGSRTTGDGGASGSTPQRPDPTQPTS